MIKLTFSKEMKVVAVASGIFLSAVFLFGFLFFLLTEVHPAVTWGLMLPLFILSGTLSVFSILEAFFAYCSFDNENGIEFYSGFAKVNFNRRYRKNKIIYSLYIFSEFTVTI